MSSPVPMDHEEQRIRETAYQLWEKDGCPAGQAERYWEMAQNMAGEPESRPSTSAAKPRRAASKKASAGKSKKSAVQ
jgi:hypothetical protein